jgi:UTP--glucose-1-phosphate uridylyltransferase
LLPRLLDAGYEYAFVSNADNLGAVIEPAILGYLVSEGLPFLMEVADRTSADRKGGHLAQLQDGRFVLRESAQCPAEDEATFQDIERHCFFNTNNLWLHLPAIREKLEANGGFLSLPMIRNEKTLDPRDADSPGVYQLETAMGAAIQVFPRAGAIRVPRHRFSPVKTTDDLLAVRSDYYRLTEDHRVVPDPAQEGDHLTVTLDQRFYRLVDEMDARFPDGPPSLRACRRLLVEGDIRFGRGIRIRGDVRLVNLTDHQLELADGLTIEGIDA